MLTIELLSLPSGDTSGSSEIGGLSSGTGIKSVSGSLEGRKGDGDTASSEELDREMDGLTADDGVTSPEDLEDLMERLDPSVEDRIGGR